MVNIKYCILGVEGSHDQAFIGKLLSEQHGFEPFDGDSGKLTPFWEKFKPAFPKKLYTRLDMPSIFFSSTHSVLIFQGEGSNLSKNLKGRIREHDPYLRDIHAFGLVLDADEKSPKQKVEHYSKEFREFYPHLVGAAGEVIAGKPRTGIYVFPDNKRDGTLDCILVDCAEVIYPDLKVVASQFLDGVSDARKSEAKWKKYDPEKAMVATIVSVLKPGISNTPSIAQNNWICKKTVNDVSEVTLFDKFLKDLLDLP